MLIEPLALLALALPQATHLPAPLDSYDTRRKADALFAARDWAGAVALYEELAASFRADGVLWSRLGVGRYYLRRHEEATGAFEQALAVGVRNPSATQYNLACCYALTDERESAFRHIDAALSARWDDRGRLEQDGDLARLHDDPRWVERVGTLPAGDWDRDSGWRFDVDFLVAEAQRMNPGPARPAYSTRFTESAAELRAAIPNLTDDEVLGALQRLVAILNDGHSAIYGPGPDTPLAFDGRTLPFKFYAFPSGLTIVDGAGEWASLAGSRVLRFGALSSEEVLQRMQAYRGVDNAMTWAWMVPQFYVRRFAMLREVGVEPVGDTVELTLLAPNGEERRVEVPGDDFDLVRKLRPSPAATGDVPRYLAAVDTNYSLAPLPEYGALYFQFNQVRDDANEPIAAFAERLRAALASADVTNLIVDVRHNNGGNNTLVRPLVRALVEFELRAPDNRIFVLTGRNTFSAAQNFINRIERWTDALFVGEPSSSSPNFVGEDTDLVLPYSRVRGSLSNRYWQDSDPGDDRAWIAPDIPIELTAEDYFANRDPVLDAVLELLARD